MNDALIDVVQIVKSHAELFAVVAQRVDLLFSDRVCDWERAVVRWNVVVGCGDGSRGPSDSSASESQAFERLSAGYFMNQMQIDIENGLFSGFAENRVVVPNFLEHRAWRFGGRGHRKRFWSRSLILQ